MKTRRTLVATFCTIALFLLLVPVSFAQSPQGPQRDGGTYGNPLTQPLPPGIKVRAFIHRPRVVEPAHLGTCDPVTTDSANYGLTEWHLPAGGITWKLNESTVPTTIGAALARAVINDAFATWTAADTQKAFVDGGKTTAKGARFDGVNAILWGRLGASSIAVTYVWYYTTTGLVAEVDTVFNKRYPWRVFPEGDGCSVLYDAYDLENIAVHEFGHWIGLDDLYNDVDADLTMYGFGAGGELKKRTLATGDILGANAISP